MDIQLLFLCFLTFVIHLIGTLAYSVRIAGVRTGRIAVSLALFSILALVSRTSTSFLQPLQERRDASLRFRIVPGRAHGHADPTHAFHRLRPLYVADCLANRQIC